jgi:hypothetical protein
VDELSTLIGLLNAGGVVAVLVWLNTRLASGDLVPKASLKAIVAEVIAELEERKELQG